MPLFAISSIIGGNMISRHDHNTQLLDNVLPDVVYRSVLKYTTLFYPIPHSAKTGFDQVLAA